MAQQLLNQPPLTAEGEQEIAEARAELMRRAQEQGITPFDFDAALGEGADGQTQDQIRQEVDEFLRVVRETRDIPATGSIE